MDAELQAGIKKAADECCDKLAEIFSKEVLTQVAREAICLMMFSAAATSSVEAGSKVAGKTKKPAKRSHSKSAEKKPRKHNYPKNRKSPTKKGTMPTNEQVKQEAVVIPAPTTVGLESQAALVWNSNGGGYDVKVFNPVDGYLTTVVQHRARLKDAKYYATQKGLTVTSVKLDPLAQ